MAEIDDALTRFRAELLATERQAASAMVRVYGESWTRINRELTALQQQAREERQRGETVALAALLLLGRLETLRNQIARELALFVDYADGVVLAQQRMAVDAARVHAPELTRLALGDGPISVPINPPPVGETEALIGVAADGLPLLALLASIGRGIPAAMIDMLRVGLVTGQSARAVARQLRRQYSVGLSRALQIGRTEMMRSYREASRLTYAANRDIVTGWYWQAKLDRRTCASCWAMHGSFHTLDETLDDHPGGRCTMRPAIKRGVTDLPPPARGADIFAEQPEAVQRAVLGPAAFLAYQAGALPLADLVGRRTDARWGSMRHTRSLVAVLGPEAERWKVQARS